MTNVVVVTVLADPDRDRQSSALLTATDGRQGNNLSRSAARRRQVLPGLASPVPASPHRIHAAPHGTPVPFTAHETPRAIRVRRSPR